MDDHSTTPTILQIQASLQLKLKGIGFHNHKGMCRFSKFSISVDGRSCGKGFIDRNLRRTMAHSSSTPIPRIGIPVNLLIAAVVGAMVGWAGEGVEYGISTTVLLAITAGFFVQEGLLVQVLSRDANIAYQHRLLGGEVSPRNRKLMLFGPFSLLLLIGLALAVVSGVDLGGPLLVRILCVSLIVMFGVDPLFGLSDRGILAVFGASVVYIIILQAGFDGHQNITSSIEPYIGASVAMSIATAVVTYLLLSSRWTYYRLFCFNQVDDLRKVFADTGLPLLLVLLPYFPAFVEVLQRMFLGA